MQAHLGAGSASCQICVEPLGRLEDFRAPFVAACGHVFCLLCLHDGRPNAVACCPLCRTPYDRAGYLRLAGLAGTVPHRLRTFDMGAKLRGDIARVDGLTDVMQLRTLHDDARRFLDSQPRNRFADLDTNVRLLRCFLEAKETVQAQATLVNALVEQVHQLGADKAQMHRQLRDAERQYAREREYVRSRVYDLIRQDPDFNLLSEEVLQFQVDINDLRQAVHALGSEIAASAASPPGTPTGEAAPSIRIFPASPSLRHRPSTLGSASSVLSPLSMSVIGDDFGALASLMYGPRLTVPQNEDIDRAREAVFAQIRRRRSGGLRTGALATPPLPPRPPARSLSDESITTAGELYDNELPTPRAPSPASSSAPSSAPSDDEDEGGTATPYYSPLSNSAGLPGSPPDLPTIDPRSPSAPAFLEDAAGTEAATPALQILRTPAALRHARSVSRLVERLPTHLVQLLGRTIGDPPAPDGGVGTGVLEFFERVFPYRGERTASTPPGSSAAQSGGGDGDFGSRAEVMPPVLGPGTLDDTSAGEYQESVSAGRAQ